jgi:hypothetical protein
MQYVNFMSNLFIGNNGQYIALLKVIIISLQQLQITPLAVSSTSSILKAVSWLRRFVAGLSPRRLGFSLGSVHVGFVVDKVILGQVFLRVLRLSSVSIIPLVVLHTHVSPGGRTISLVAAFRRQSHTIEMNNRYEQQLRYFKKLQHSHNTPRRRFGGGAIAPTHSRPRH